MRTGLVRQGWRTRAYMAVLAACLRALYRKWQINKVLWNAGSWELGAGSREPGAGSWEQEASSASSAFRYNVYRPCAPRMAHLSIHGCTCCVPASVISIAAVERSAVFLQALYRKQPMNEVL